MHDLFFAPLRVSLSRRGLAYRPEIDGLRALAVLVVIANHLNSALVPQGFLGVDIFFVISGYVVTSSLMAHQAENSLSFLKGFYGRRFRRLLPALVGMVLLVSLLFCMVVSAGEDLFPPSMRTGIAALLGVANLYLLRQGSGYFSLNTSYNPFMHTWSLGVEEQFYLVWPLVLLICGVGRAGSDRVHRRHLAVLTLLVLAASLAVFVRMTVNGQTDQAFYLMPCRFWELALGCLAYLVHRGGGGLRDSGISIPWENQRAVQASGLAAALVLLLLLPFQVPLWSNLLVTLLTALLLVVLQPRSGGAASMLSHSWVVAIGLLSYSLYLWHWPWIVLARWTVGVNRFTILPILVATAVAALFSYRLETLFRYGQGSAPWQSRPFLFFPVISMVSAAVVAALQGPIHGLLFLGRHRGEEAETSNMKRIQGTPINTVNCFLDPTAPLSTGSLFDRCRAQPRLGRPTLYFEGDSHAHALMPLGEALLKDGHYNVSFFARGGCPAPYFSPWSGGRDRLDRYKLCESHYRSRKSMLLAALKPGDRVVFVSNLPGYFGLSKTSAAYRNAVRDLDSDIRSRGGRLVLFSALPYFDGPEIKVPLSLCRPEWFRPAWAKPSDCRPMSEARGAELSKTEPVRSVLADLADQSTSIDVFDPFADICPADQAMCSTQRQGQLLFGDSNHLTNAGALRLYRSFLSFLARTEVPPPQPASPASPPSPP